MMTVRLYTATIAKHWKDTVDMEKRLKNLLADKAKENMKQMKEIYKRWKRQVDENNQKNGPERESQSCNLASLPDVFEAPKHIKGGNVDNLILVEHTHTQSNEQMFDSVWAYVSDMKNTPQTLINPSITEMPIFFMDIYFLGAIMMDIFD